MLTQLCDQAILFLNIPGADFIKTSTGKEGVNAILPVGLVMVRAIRDYYQRTKHKVCVKSILQLRSYLWQA